MAKLGTKDEKLKSNLCYTQLREREVPDFGSIIRDSRKNLVPPIRNLATNIIKHGLL